MKLSIIADITQQEVVGHPQALTSQRDPAHVGNSADAGLGCSVGDASQSKSCGCLRGVRHEVGSLQRCAHKHLVDQGDLKAIERDLEGVLEDVLRQPNDLAAVEHPPPSEMPTTPVKVPPGMALSNQEHGAMSAITERLADPVSPLGGARAETSFYPAKLAVCRRTKRGERKAVVRYCCQGGCPFLGFVVRIRPLLEGPHPPINKQGFSNMGSTLQII